MTLDQILEQALKGKKRRKKRPHEGDDTNKVRDRHSKTLKRFWIGLGPRRREPFIWR